MVARLFQACSLAGACCAVLVHGAALAQAPVITGVEHYTENRGWNKAGLGPYHQVIVAAHVAPSDYPTLVFAEADGRREPMLHFPQPQTPNLYVLWTHVEPGAPRAWRISSERGAARARPSSRGRSPGRGSSRSRRACA